VIEADPKRRLFADMGFAAMNRQGCVIPTD
jgi:hypothetical protein